MPHFSAFVSPSKFPRLPLFLRWLPVLLLALGTLPPARAQTCSLVFDTQAAVDSYVASGTRCPTPTSLQIRGLVRDINGNSNGGVSDVSGLQHITAVTGAVSITLNELSSLSGLANIQQIGGDLNITNATGFSRELPAFPNLQRVNGAVLFGQNPALTSISGFGQLQSAGYISFGGSHTNLASITGFGALTTAAYIYITSLPALRSVSGFNSLSTLAGSAPGTGNTLFISDNPVLETIPAFDALTALGNITISNNTRLQAIVGFNALRSASSVTISNNAALGTISGFNGPLVATGNLRISQHAALETLAGFDGLEVAQVSIGDNPRLREIASFNNSTLTGQLSIYNNAGLEKITGFQSVIIGGGSSSGIVITGHPLLDSISGMTGASAPRLLALNDNPALQSLAPGFTFADYSTLNVLSLVNNSRLSGCSVPWLCQYLARNGFANISGNATGCTDAAIRQACTTLATRPGAAKRPAPYPNPADDVLQLPARGPYRVSDLAGRVLLHGTGSYVLLAELPAGLYLVHTGPDLQDRFRIVKR